MAPVLHNYCVQCRKELTPSFAFCPACGGDNRPPEQRSPVAAHQHDNRFGPYCPVCGEAYRPDAPGSGGSTYMFRPFPLAPLYGIAALLAAAYVCTFSLPASHYRSQTTPSSMQYVLAGLLAVFGVGILPYRSWVAVDLGNQSVHTLRGIGPLAVRRTFPISDIQSVMLTTRRVYSRYGYRYYHDLYLMVGSGRLFLASSSQWFSHWEEGRELAMSIGKPFSGDEGDGWATL